MKKFFTIMIIAMFASAAFAQVPEQLKKGTIAFQADVTNIDLRLTNGVSLNLGGLGQYFIMDKLGLVGGIGLNVDSNEQVGAFGETTTSSTTTFDLAFGARYYFLESKKGSLFATAGFKLATGAGDTQFGFLLNGGYSFFLNRHISIEPLVSLDLPFSKGSNVNFNIGAGISIYL